MTHSTAEAPPRAVLLGVQLPGVTPAEYDSSIAELRRLARTLGLDVVASVSQRRHTLSAVAVVGDGKLKELAKWTGGTGIVPSGATERKSKARDKREGAAKADDDEAESVTETVDDGGDSNTAESESDASGPDVPAGQKADTVVVDHEISPTQARNLERATGARVLDRTGVIVEIFHRHARSREARAQVEIARLKYLAPRLRAAGGADRQRGGIGGKGAGESSIELDRRRIRDRIAELRAEIVSIQRDHGTRRSRRSDQARVALVGYTNAGKSSLMRALTGSDVLVEDKLFATLDTTVRALHPESVPRILVSDTVGFIKKLPHDLVASFRSTLDEALEAALLLHIVDAADESFRAQYQVTREVLDEIGAGQVPSRLVLNKIDRVDGTVRDALRKEFPEAMLLSAHDKADVLALREVIIAYFERDMIEQTFDLAFDGQRVLADIRREARVVKEDWHDTGLRVTLRAPRDAMGAIAERLGNPPERR